jgi:hypothetical protein
LKPVPVTFTTGADKSTLPLLVSVTIRGVLFVPAITLPKLIFLGDNPTVSLLLVADGLDCARAWPPRAYKAAQIAITTVIARRDKIIRRHILRRRAYVYGAVSRRAVVRR